MPKNHVYGKRLKDLKKETQNVRAQLVLEVITQGCKIDTLEGTISHRRDISRTGFWRQETQRDLPAQEIGFDRLINDY